MSTGGTRTTAGVDVPVPASERLTLDNGFRLILVPRHDVPLVAFDLALRGGARLDAPGRAGTAALTADLLTHGAGTRDAFAFADVVEGAGGSLDAEAQADAIHVHGQFLARDAPLLLQLLADAVQRPALAAADFTALRARRIEELRSAKDSAPQSLLAGYGRALLFAGHAYGQPVGGSERSLARLVVDDVRGYFAGQTGADRATLVIAGDFDPQQVTHDARALFAAWRRAPAPLPGLAPTHRRRGRRVLLVDAPGSSQSYFWLGNTGVPRAYAQRAPLQLANIALGGRFGSLLNQALRVDAGLTYGVGSYFARGLVAGEFAIESFTGAATTGQALDLALATLARLHATGLDDATLASARSYLLGQFPTALQTSADWAMTLADLDLYDLPERFIGGFGSDLVGTGADEVNAVIATAFPSADDLDIVLIADAAKVQTDAARYGPVTTLPLSADDFACSP